MGNQFFWVLFVFVFLLGVAIGSFLNVVILRQNVGGKKRKRSICLSCGKTLESKDLFPIISFILLRGRCRHCKCRISWQYPLVEIATGILFVVSFLNVLSIKPVVFALWSGVSLISICSVLVVIFVYDLFHKIINDGLVIIFGAIAFLRIIIFYLVSGDFGSMSFFLDLLSGPVSALPFFLLWFLSKGRFMGLGDAKLMLGLGWFLGWTLWPSAFILAFWLGAFVVLFLMALSRIFSKSSLFGNFAKIGRKSEVPFGPFLIVATLICFFAGLNIFQAFFPFFV